MLGCHGLFETHVFFFFFGPCSNRCTYTRNTHTQTQKQNYNASLYSPLFPFFFCFFSFFFLGFRVAPELSFFFLCPSFSTDALSASLLERDGEEGGGCQRKTLAKGRDRRSMNVHDRNSRSCADRPFFFFFFFFASITTWNQVCLGALASLFHRYTQSHTNKRESG